MYHMIFYKNIHVPLDLHSMSSGTSVLRGFKLSSKDNTYQILSDPSPQNRVIERLQERKKWKVTYLYFSSTYKYMYMYPNKKHTHTK